MKQRISPLSTDVESEIAVCLLAQEMGVPCCLAQRYDADAVFSAFEYDFTNEYVVHMRRLFNGARGENELENLLAVRPQFADDFYRMVMLDFATRQDDRHLSNMAIKVSEAGEEFYPLVRQRAQPVLRRHRGHGSESGGRSRCLRDHVRVCGNVLGPSDRHGAPRRRFGRLANLDVPERTVRALLEKAGFTGYRLAGAEEWIIRCLDLMRGLSA